MRAQKLIGRLILGLMALGALMAQFLGEKLLFGILDSLPPVCPMKLVLKLKCSFCGMTHAFFHLAFGEFRNAFHENVLSIPVFLVLTLGAGAAALGRLPDLKDSQKRKILIFSIGILLIYTILRNLP
jgi:hypothetical protein